MRTRLLATLAVVAAALLAPAAALAVTAPSISAPPITNVAPQLSWLNVGDATGYQAYRADGDCSGSPSFAPVGIVMPGGATGFTDNTPSLPADGTYCYKVQSFDAIPTTADSNLVSVIYDATPPVSSLGGVTGATTVRGTLNLTAAPSDAGSGLDTVSFWYRSLPGGTPQQIGPTINAPGTYAASFDTTGVTDGNYEFQSVATDDAGNATTITATNVAVDNTAPGVTLTGVGAGTNVRGTLNLSSSPTDGGSGVASVSFWYRSLPGGSFQQIGTTINSPGPYTAPFDTTGVTDGNYEFKAVATDAIGNPNTAIVTNVTVDNTGPVPSLGGVSAGTSVRGTLNLTSSPTDPGSGVASVSFWYRSLPGGTFQQIGTTDNAPGPYGVSFDTTSVVGGSYEFQARETDALGNPSSATVSNVLVDNDQPTGGITTLQATLANIHGSVGVDASAADGGAGVDKVEFQSSPTGLNTFTTFDTDNTNNAVSYHGTLNTAAIQPSGADGVYDLRIKITDLAGNTAFSSVLTPVRVDNHAPSIPGNPTGQPAVISTPVVTFGASTDPNFNGFSGVDHYNVFRGATPAGVVQAPATSFTDNSALADGFYTYTFVAVDKAGNASGASTGFQVHVDSTAASAPTSVTLLASPTSQRPQLTFVAPASAPFLAHYNVYRNSALLTQTVAAGATSFTDSEASLPDGSYTYQLVATDGGSQFGVASAGVTIVYDTTAPAAPGGVTASAALDGTITIGWQPASDGSGSGVARYVVRRSLSSAPPATIADGDATCSGTATSCTDATALNGKLYSYAVFAVDNAGNTSLAGITPGVTAHDQTPPPAPKGLAATPADASVSLRWTPAGPDDDVAGYVLVAKPGAQAPTSETDGTRVCTDIVSTSSACTATGLTNGATYTFGLFALDEALNRSQPAVVSAAPNGKVTDAKAPAAVSKLKAKVSGNKVTLTWKNPSDHDFDHVEITAGERKPSALKASKRVYAGKGTKTTTTIPAGQSRWFVVVAYDAVGNASQPATVHVTIAAPSKFGPAPRAKVHGKVKLSWPVVKGAKYYNVQVYAGKKRILVSWPSGRALQLPRAKLKVGKTYTWYVWPGLGAKAKAHYGKLIGKNAFTLTG